MAVQQQHSLSLPHETEYMVYGITVLGEEITAWKSVLVT